MFWWLWHMNFTVQEEGPNVNETTGHQKCYLSSFRRFGPYKMGRYQLQVGVHHFSCRCELTPVKPIEVRSFIGAPFHSIQDRQTGPTTCRNQLLNSTNHLMSLPIIWWFLGLAPFRMHNKNNLSFRFPNEKAIERAGTFQFQSGPPATYLYIYILYTCGIGWIEDADFWNLNVFTVACCVFYPCSETKEWKTQNKNFFGYTGVFIYLSYYCWWKKSS